MKKLSALLLAALFLLLCACSSADSGTASSSKLPLPSAEALARELLASGAFSEEMDLAAVKSGCFLYGLEETAAEDMAFCFSGGATAEELAVFFCANADAAALAEAAVRDRISRQSESYASYKPEEVPKLDKALITVSGNAVVVCVCADTASAQAVLDRYF